MTDRLSVHTDRHNHSSQPQFEYVGMSEKNPNYHLWRCTAKQAKAKKEVALVPHNPKRFDPESKAGKGGCSMRLCPGDAVFMDVEGHRAYCELCAQRYTDGQEPCPVTRAEVCQNKLGLNVGPYPRPCTVC